MSKAVDQTDKEAEYYRAMVVSQGDTIELLKHNIRELQEQLQNSYKRIAELVDGNMERQTSDRH
tara:strand:- start:578 stop:769 length:192 start_codon:yes stop_codon:yes gene_type:complete